MHSYVGNVKHDHNENNEIEQKLLKKFNLIGGINKRNNC